VAARYLVKHAHVASTIGTNPKTIGNQRYLVSADIEAFNRSFVPLRALSSRMGMSLQHLRQDLLGGHAAPFAPAGRDLEALYRWPEIENKLWCRWPRM
jgi:lambda repressor-like predicted transcriptional regulator